MERILSALTTQKAQSFDRFFTKAITNNLYFGSFDTNSTGAEFGADLIAFNIQRGRDHGIRNYNDVRCFCGMKRAGTTAPPEINPTTWQLLLQAYNGNPDDIELFPAMVSETPVPEGVVGRTMACIIAEQFKRIRYGDRFFFANHYEDCPEPNCGRGLLDHEKPFIPRRYLSHIICENSNIEAIQQDVFKPVSYSNPLVPCSQFPKFGFQEIEAFFRIYSKSPCLEEQKKATNLASCPDGGVLNPVTQKCYYVRTEVKGWTEARDACRAEGFELATIESATENAFVFGLLSDCAWIGLNDRTTEGTYEWSDGSQSEYRNWNPGEPRALLSGEDCVVMNCWNYGEHWDDCECSVKFHYVCTLKINP
ncbi:unnamed protein product [Cyprideis torosa]|uniref:Uncharacterized protein n=1 Tax=Cyprideis torosa TaxID=163714 RepID=A0A7R8WJN9_9CRUS|nr:unnamed protein product [Cyprideis torosa]CAG0896179.1 unnamed protein product [Cyprideis torosa]